LSGHNIFSLEEIIYHQALSISDQTPENIQTSSCFLSDFASQRSSTKH